jgi:hypothetical protein
LTYSTGDNLYQACTYQLNIPLYKFKGDSVVNFEISSIGENTKLYLRLGGEYGNNTVAEFLEGETNPDGSAIAGVKYSFGEGERLRIAAIPNEGASEGTGFSFKF